MRKLNARSKLLIAATILFAWICVISVAAYVDKHYSRWAGSTYRDYDTKVNGKVVKAPVEIVGVGTDSPERGK